MKYYVCSVFDKVSKTYTPPQFHQSESEAIRAFDSSIKMACARKDGYLFTHKDDFELFCLGGFDSDLGLFDFDDLEFDKPFLLIRGCDVYAE